MGWGRLIRTQNSVHNPTFFVGWSIWLLLLMCFHYLGIWEYQAVDFQTVGQLVLLLLPPIVLVLLTFVLVPEPIKGQSINLTEHYYEIRYWLFGLSTLFFILSFLADMMLPDFYETWWDRASLLLVIVITISVLMVTKNKYIHFSSLAFNVLWLLLGSIFNSVRAL